MIQAILKKIQVPFFSSIFLIACSPYSYNAYFQMQEVTPIDKNMQCDELIYKDSVLKISYDFWANEGKSSMVLENISNQLIYIDLELTHLIVNGNAYSYYSPRTVSISSSNTNGKLEQNLFNSRRYSSTQSTQVYEESVDEPKYVIIPPHSRKKIEGYNVSQQYKDCQFKKYPKNDSLTFKIQNTPFEFSNLIYYRKNTPDSDPISIKNSFWISQINNFSYTHFVKYYYPKNCGVKSQYTEKYYPYQAKNKFFIKHNNP
jgi:hypothetical protein